MKKFITKNKRGEELEVSYCQAVIGSGVIKMDWSISNFGFGEFYCFQNKNKEVVADNEHVSRNILEQVFACGFYNMVNPLEDKVQIIEGDVVYKDIRDQFKKEEDGFQIYYAMDNFSADGDILTYEFWSGLSKRFVLKVRKYPDFDELDDTHFCFSKLLNDGNWEQYFISGKCFKVSVDSQQKLKEYKEIEDCILVYNDISDERYVRYKFKEEDKYHFSQIEGDLKTNRTYIRNFPYSKDLLADIGLHVGKTIKMTD